MGNIAELFQKHPEFRSRTTQVYVIRLKRAIVRSNGVKVCYYCGSTKDLTRRLKEHRNGKSCNGSPLLHLANQRGIGWELIAVWDASREFEKYVKRQKGIRRFIEAYSKA